MLIPNAKHDVDGQDSMVWVEALVPFDKGELLSTIHQVGMVERTVSIHSLFI